MTWLYFVFAFVCGVMCGFLYGHFRGLHDMMEYDIQKALRAAHAQGYLTRALEEKND